MLEFTKYGPKPPVEKDPPPCVVAYPEACGRFAVGEVWSLPFCEAHGTEAHIAACLEAYEDAERTLDRLTIPVEGEHAVRNPLVYEAIEGMTFPPNGFDLDHVEAIRAAYDLDAATTNPDTLAYDYEDWYSHSAPHDWWSEAREMVVGLMREAYVAGHDYLLKSLEPIREYVTVQQVLASEDVERRWVAPRRAAREECRRTEEEGRTPAEILNATNRALSSAVDLLHDVSPEAFGREDDYFRAKQAIAEAGLLVAKAERPHLGDAATRPAE